jgi:hypothetical protein
MPSVGGYHRLSVPSKAMGDSPRYRLDLGVPPEHDVHEADDTARDPTLDHIRANLADDPRWAFVLAPWRPYGEEQHLIVWLDLAEAREPSEIGNAVHDVVSQCW